MTITRMHYDLLEEYRKQQYKNLLTLNNVISDKLHISKVTIPGGGVVDDFDFWGYSLAKDGVKYLLSSVDSEGKDIKLKELLPIYPEGLEEVAYRGQAYKLINEPVPARIEPLPKLSFKELVSRLGESSHTNREHQVLHILTTLAQRFYRVNVRLATPPGFGKDSMVVTLNNLVGGSGSVTNPTIAKLEYMTYLKHLVINEVSSIAKAEWDVIQQFLLDTGDFKPSTFKRSRGDREILDLTELSLALYFNDITEYSNIDRFFDSKTDGNVKDRFVPFRFYGRYDEHFEAITTINAEAYVKNNFDYYKDIVSSYYYYKENINSLLHGYEQPDLSAYPERWRNNLAWILKVVDLYSDSLDEYHYWWGLLRNSIRDYEEMLKFPEYFSVLVDLMGIPKSVYGNGVSLHKVLAYLQARAKSAGSDKKELFRAKARYVEKIISEPLFANKNVMCASFKPNNHSKELAKW